MQLAAVHPRHAPRRMLNGMLTTLAHTLAVHVPASADTLSPLGEYGAAALAPAVANLVNLRTLDLTGAATH